MRPPIEYRAGSALELRASRPDGPPRIRGYAAMFDTLSVDLGGFRERIQRGAFARTLREQADVRALVEHDPARILGRTKAGTLQLWEDATGLGFEVDPPETQLARDTVTSIARGDLSQASFAFRVVPGGERWSEDAQGRPIRTLLDVDLFDCSVVAYPAYVQTEVGLTAAAGGARTGWRETLAALRRRLDSVEEIEAYRRKLRLRELELGCR